MAGRRKKAKTKEDGRFQQRSLEEYDISSSSSANTRPQHALGNQAQAELARGTPRSPPNSPTRTSARTDEENHPASESTSVTHELPEPFPETAPSEKQSRPRRRFQPTKLVFGNASSPMARTMRAQLTMRATQLKLDSNGCATADVSQIKSPTSDSRETNEFSKSQPTLSRKAKKWLIKDQKARRISHEAMRKRTHQEREERLKDGNPSQKRRTTADIQGSMNDTAAHHALRRAFPDGWQRLRTSGVDLECGLHAIILSIEHQRPDISTPMLQDLRDISQRETVALDRPIVGIDNSSNFTVGRLGAILYEWGQSHNSNLQLGYVQPGRQANLIGTLDDGRDDVNIIWIYKNNPTGQSERHIDHFEGLSRLHVWQPSAASKVNPVAQPVKELESRLSAATDQRQEQRRHHAIDANGSLGLFNSGLTSTSHSVPFVWNKRRRE